MHRCYQLIALLIAARCWSQPAFPTALAQAPTRTRTNTFLLTWDRPIGYVIFSNRVTRTSSNSVTRWWVGDVTQSVFTVIQTQFNAPHWQVTVAALGLELSGESQPAFWPPSGPTNIVIQIYTQLSPSNRLPLLTQTNPSGNLFVRLWFQPTNATFTNPLWFSQSSTNFANWIPFGQPIAAPQSPRLQLGITNFSF